MRLTRENFQSGLLVDETWMAGIHHRADRGVFFAFVVDHTTGETVGQAEYPSFEAASQALEVLGVSMGRSWRYERASGCSNENCGAGRGQCGGPKSCGLRIATSNASCKTGACPTTLD
jgi:hypothetical protein